MTLSTDAMRLIKAIYGDQWAKAWVEWGTFDDAKKFTRSGFGRAGFMKNGMPPEDQAVYWSAGLIKPAATRANSNVVAVKVVVIDDVGTKIDLDAMKLFAPPPTVVIETSPGNYQWQYGIDGGMEPGRYRALRQQMKGHPVWGHSEATAPSNLIRLPMGVNGKPGLRDWKVRAVAWGELS